MCVREREIEGSSRGEAERERESERIPCRLLAVSGHRDMNS